MGTRIFLGASALIWLPYGLYCFFQPGYLAEVAGVTAASATAQTEIRAMYGGLQAAIGVLAGLAVFRESLRIPALTTLLFLCAGLGSFRLMGVALDGGLSAYTIGGLTLEFGLVALSAFFLGRTPAPATA
jgi:hypothetical protein